MCIRSCHPLRCVIEHVLLKYSEKKIFHRAYDVHDVDMLALEADPSLKVSIGLSLSLIRHCSTLDSSAGQLHSIPCRAFLCDHILGEREPL